MLEGKRDGFGIVYCTTTRNFPYLFECEWSQGTPIQGRYILIVQNQWKKYEGMLDEEYRLTGAGSLHLENGCFYEGLWSQGTTYERGTIAYPDGSLYEGGWENCERLGHGRLTEENGDYHEGEWKGWEIGVHQYFTKEGVVVKSFDHGQ